MKKIIIMYKNKIMNIALFDAAPYWSGGAERVYFCCKGYSELGHKVTLVCLPTSRLNHLLKDKIKIYNLSPITDFDIFCFIKILWIIKKENIKIIDVHSPKFYWLCLFAAKLLRCKFGITRNVLYRKSGIKRLINKFLYQKCDFIVAVSQKVKHFLMTDFALDNNKITVIYDGLEIKPVDDTQKYKVRSYIRDKFNISNDTILLSTIGRIEKNKGYHIIIKSIKKVVEKGYNIKLLIIGKVEDKKFFYEIINLIRTLSLEDKIFFTGFKKNVLSYILASDIIVSGSYTESMGKSILESIVYKIPFVATEACQVKEIVSGETGIFVPTGNETALAEGIIQIIKHKDIYLNNLSKIDTSKFDYKKMVMEYIETYNQLYIQHEKKFNN